MLVGKLTVYISQRDQYIYNAFHGLPLKILFHMSPMYNKSLSELLQAAMYYEEALWWVDLVKEQPMPLVRVFNVRTAAALCPNYFDCQRPFFCK